jgi:hypothetical protein
MPTNVSEFTVIAGVFTVLWACLQIGDRLWGWKHERKSHHISCHYEPVSMAKVITEVVRTQEKILELMGDVTQALSNIAAELKTQTEVEKLRYEQMFREMIEMKTAGRQQNERRGR